MTIAPSNSSTIDPAITERHRQKFPALTDKAYFNYGGQGPMARESLDAIQQAHETMQQKGPFAESVYAWLSQELGSTRKVLAQELQIPMEALTLTENVTVGCNIALWGLDWQAGDHLLMSDCEHPGVIAAAQELSRRYGVELTTCPLLATLNQGDPTAIIAEHLRPETRLLMISHILWNTGQVIPLQEIVEVCHAHAPNPVWVLVDAAQSAGALPLRLTDSGVDFYAFTGHKWWCGPAGLGGLYIRPEVFEQIHPTFIGRRGITVDEAGNPAAWQSSGKRFEISTSDFSLAAGLKSAIALHNQWGSAEARYQRICELSHYLWERLTQLPKVACLRTTPPESGIVSFQINSDSAAAANLQPKLVAALEQQGIFLRTLLHPNCIRACTHYFTLESEIDRLVEAIQQWIANEIIS
ncbi:MAG: aminotransferase class V-fold PLP-dependent enzyme [Leptolyngbyaceae cyanobacterium MO_188.B28]|nr:aminotransferase class V-fold PLP-dependent enzyme [Leptolyngbyaceae cyanobacterium MO_188.B28]